MGQRLHTVLTLRGCWVVVVLWRCICCGAGLGRAGSPMAVEFSSVFCFFFFFKHYQLQDERLSAVFMTNQLKCTFRGEEPSSLSGKTDLHCKWTPKQSEGKGQQSPARCDSLCLSNIKVRACFKNKALFFSLYFSFASVVTLVFLLVSIFALCLQSSFAPSSCWLNCCNDL